MEFTFERVLPKEDQMEMCKQLRLAGTRGVWGGRVKEIMLGGNWGLMEDLLGSFDFSACTGEAVKSGVEKDL